MFGITSSQTSGLIGGQQAMFANQAAFSHQIAGTYGMGSQNMAGQGMQNPYPAGMPSYGMASWGQSNTAENVVGGAAKALPGLAMGAGIAGMMAGGAASYLDPVTGVAKQFAGGAGVGGSGIGGFVKGLGAVTRAGGLRAGGAALAGGAFAALPAVAGYYAAGKAIETVAGNVFQGTQNISDVRQMSNQIMGPQFGQAGAERGGGVGRGVVKNITSFLHEVASEDVMTSMQDMRKLMGQAGQMGMMGGVMDASTFKTKFRKIIDQTKNIAQILGTSLEEAMPMLAQMNQMGMWKSSDIMGTSLAAKAAGPGAAPHMMAAMQSGAQMSHAMGGRMAAGATLGREMFGNIAAGVQGGFLSNEQISEYTGGTGGVAGQRMVASSMQRIMSGFGRSPMGRLMMAGLGEQKGGAFTGEMSGERMNQFLSGELDVGDL